MKQLLAGTLLVAGFAGLMALPPDGLAASKQGGGAFAPAAPAKKKTVRKKPTATQPRKAAVTPQVSFDGAYTGRFVLLTKNTDMPCWSGRREFAIRGNRTRIQTFPVIGDTLGGTISGTTLRIVKAANGSLPDPWDWRGNVNLPTARGQTGAGTLIGESAAGEGCTWRLEITRK